MSFATRQKDPGRQVPTRRQAGARGDGLDLAAQQGGFRHPRAVRGGREQTDETVLAVDRAVGAVKDVVAKP